MLYLQFVKSFFQAGLLTVLMLSVISISGAQVMTSPSYQIQSDSVNIGGGLSSSTNYIQESTIGEVATGPSDSTGYSLRAGYQQMQTVFLSLSTPNDITMAPNLLGLTGGTSNGSTTFTVITDGPSGYQLTIAAENSPAMQSGANTIADYDAGVVTDYIFDAPAGEAYFGFSPEGVDVVQAFLDNNASVCGVGSFDASLACWDGLSTAETVIASSGGSNHPSGATTTLNFRVGIGSGAGVISGVYTATSTITALPL